jgi:hypothetical protein
VQLINAVSIVTVPTGFGIGHLIPYAEKKFRQSQVTASPDGVDRQSVGNSVKRS